MRRRRLLDAYCRKGGSSMGYLQAGWDVVGVDVEDHSDGFPGDFVQGDAVDFIRRYGRDFDLIHAGPPCQSKCMLTAGTNRETRAHLHVDLLPETRVALEETGRPYVIEQPQGNAPMRCDVLLCGLHFGLRVFRHRQFELGHWSTEAPAHDQRRLHAGHRVAGWRHGVRYEGDMLAVYGDGGGKGSLLEWQQGMGIDWMHDKKDLAEAIPPAYTRWLGERALEHFAALAA